MGIAPPLTSDHQTATAARGFVWHVRLRAERANVVLDTAFHLTGTQATCLSSSQMKSRRSYDMTTRGETAASTRDKIVRAGADLLMNSASKTSPWP
jgi:hypothetical protein